MTDTTTTPTTATTVQVYRVHIRASAEAIWEAITSPDWTDRYGYGGRVDYDLRSGGAFRSYASDEMKAFGAPDIVLDGEVLECDPPRRLVQTWRMLMDPDNEPEGFTRLTYEIDPQDDGVCRLTLTHDLTNAPRLSLITDGSSEGEGGGGWPWVLSGLKTLLETGSPLQNRS
jgi:uncharacterized protein YndB with AHSA1/START domain